QARIDHEVRLLDELSQLNDAIHQLDMVHRVDVNAHQGQWSMEFDRLLARVERTHARFPDSPGMSELPASLGQVLHQVDSLHHQALAGFDLYGDPRSTEAVLQIMLQRAQKIVDRTTRSVHEQGLSAYTSTLSDRRNEAPFLLITACLLAVVFA